MISSSVLLPFLIIQLSVAFSPGLIIALVVNQSVQHSGRKGFEVALGAATGAIGITVVSALVVSLLVNTVPVMINVIYFVGSIYIIFKGFQTVTSKSSTKEKVTNSSAFLTGFQVNLLNPKMWVFYLSVLPIFVESESSVFQSLIYLGTLTIGVNLVADITYAFLSSYFFGSSSLKSKKLINNVSGFCLILIGAYLFFSRFF